MEFRIADTFTASLARLTGDEQKAVKTTAFDLQLNPAQPGMKLHKLDKARDKNFWSVRVTSDIRLIVHRMDGSFMLCYVDHHDKAYEWASRRRLETHPKTGAAQWVEVRDVAPVPMILGAMVSVSGVLKASIGIPQPALKGVSREDLLGYGVPSDWADEVLATDEDELLKLADHLPAEAAEALLELATGGRPKAPAPAPAGADPFSHPDAQRRFRVMRDTEELARALEFPWDRWTTFLHPAQRQLVESSFKGPARVGGSAGTGKTIVALHRAVVLARRHPDARVLLTTFSDPLARALHVRLRRLLSQEHEPRLAERLEVEALDAVAVRLHARLIGRVTLASLQDLERLASDAVRTHGGHRFPPAFVLGEWLDTVDAWHLADWPAYRDFKRLGRLSRLSQAQRAVLRSMFEHIRTGLAQEGRTTRSSLFHALAQRISTMPHPPFDFVVVDEAQDVDPATLRFLSAVGGGRPDALFFAGDLGQCIFQTPFSWAAAGVDVRGRSRTLQVNYRTSHQIRAQADRLLESSVSDVDGNTDERRGTVSVFNGPLPSIRTCADENEEREVVSRWIRDRLDLDGVAADELAVIVRSADQIAQAESAVTTARARVCVLDERIEIQPGATSVCTMHLAKGLEFRAVVVMGCDDLHMPLAERMSEAGDLSDLDALHLTERHLLYVACTRARDFLLVTGVDPVSDFLADLVSAS